MVWRAQAHGIAFLVEPRRIQPHVVGVELHEP